MLFSRRKEPIFNQMGVGKKDNKRKDKRKNGFSALIKASSVAWDGTKAIEC